MRQANPQREIEGPKEENLVSYWFCSKCGAMNRDTSKYCKQKSCNEPQGSSELFATTEEQYKEIEAMVDSE